MKLNIKGLAITCAIFWGGSILVVGGLNTVWTGFGGAFLEVVASIYPGYSGEPGFGQVIIGTLYATADGAIGGAIFAWLYNCFAKD